MQSDTATRVEIVENVGAAFAAERGAARSEVLAAAAAAHSRPQVIHLLLASPSATSGWSTTSGRNFATYRLAEGHTTHTSARCSATGGGTDAPPPGRKVDRF